MEHKKPDTAETMVKLVGGYCHGREITMDTDRVFIPTDIRGGGVIYVRDINDPSIARVEGEE